MKVLLHTCCGPCTVFPLRELRGEGVEAWGVYANPNIHPFTEWERRRSALHGLAEAEGLRLLRDRDYDAVGWLRGVVFRERERCRICYYVRLREVAQLARRGGFDAFSSTLLYSTRQKHESIRETGEAVSSEVGVPFLYRDWRTGWREGIEASKDMGLYRQQYCGCLYSEQERYAGKKEMAG